MEEPLEGDFFGDFLRIDLENLTCEQIPLKGDFPCARYKHSAVLIAPNKMLVHGGATFQNYKLSDTYIVRRSGYVNMDEIGLFWRYSRRPIRS